VVIVGRGGIGEGEVAGDGDELAAVVGGVVDAVLYKLIPGHMALHPCGIEVAGLQQGGF